MALREFENITAYLFNTPNQKLGTPFHCAIVSPKEIAHSVFLKGLTSAKTRRIIRTTDKHVVLKIHDLVEVLGTKLMITGITVDETDDSMILAGKVKKEYLERMLPKIVTLE